jgi:pyruvate formate lyase activating enzyme
MQIGGFVKQSLIDYPGKIAAVVFTQGCNFRCSYCHNPSLVLPGLFCENASVSVEEVFAYLHKRKSWLDGVVVSGGEPSIHADLPDFLRKIKEMGYSIKLDTNGSNPQMLEAIIKEKLADYVAMDIKTVPEAEAYSQITGVTDATLIVENIKTSVEIIKQSSIIYEFRTTSIPGLHSPHILKNIELFLKDKKQLTINEYREGKTIACYKPLYTNK